MFGFKKRRKVVDVYKYYKPINHNNIDFYSQIIKKIRLPKYLEDGWYEAPLFHDYHYFPNEEETVVLGTPKTLKDISVNNIIGNVIIDFSPYIGTYGMGGPGYIGFKLNECRLETKKKIMVYTVWDAGAYTLLDNKVLECSPSFYEKYEPWTSLFHDPNIGWWDKLSPIIIGAKIIEMIIKNDKLEITILKDGIKHLIEMLKNDRRLPPLGNGENRKDAFEKGEISEYIVFIDENTTLHTKG